LPIDHRGIEGLGARDCGQPVLSGPLLELDARLDRAFRSLAECWNAAEYRFPPFIRAEHLDRLDYFRSFPHLATFPVALSSEAANLKRFTETARDDALEGVPLAKTAPVHHVITPAACYHAYVELEGQQLVTPVYLTMRATCCRREADYELLERQWAFSMREIVCVGSESDVTAFLAEATARIGAWVDRLGLGVSWQPATDPFFDPRHNAKYVYQKLEPVKQELVFDGRLAIGSTNYHRTYFGEAFAIRSGGVPAHSGCVAFGIERWIAAFLQRFGPSATQWPELEPLDG
jgi:hypothetical protein